MSGEPLADLESRAPVGFVVELDAEPRLERLEAARQPAGDVDDAVEEFAVGDVGEIDVDADPKVGLGREDLGPPLVAAGTHVELHLVTGQRVADRSPPRSHVVGIGEGAVDELSWRVKHARDDDLWGFGVHQCSLP